MVVRAGLVGLVGLPALVGSGASPAAAQALGPWTWPVPGPHEVVRPFAPPAVRYGAGHRGADLPAAPGGPVLAAAGGRVSYAGLLAGRGVVVVVHGDLRTTYEPVTASVAVGRVVAPGEPIGSLAPGHAGCPGAACLHWGLRRGEDYLDPVRLVARGPVRLLPLGALLPRGAGPAGDPVRATAREAGDQGATTSSSAGHPDGAAAGSPGAASGSGAPVSGAEGGSGEPRSGAASGSGAPVSVESRDEPAPEAWSASSALALSTVAGGAGLLLASRVRATPRRSRW